MTGRTFLDAFVTPELADPPLPVLHESPPVTYHEADVPLYYCWSRSCAYCPHLCVSAISPSIASSHWCGPRGAFVYWTP